MNHGPKKGFFYKTSACEMNRELVFQMAAAGKTLKDISKAVGTNRNRLSEFLKRERVLRPEKKWMVMKFPKSKPGTANRLWKGGVIITRQGYRYLYTPDHPNARLNGKYVLEHRLVMEKHIGRYLLPKEVVHHRNRDRLDNRIENLELFSSNSEHLATELKGKRPNLSEDGIRRCNEGRLKRWQQVREKALAARLENSKGQT